MQVLSFNLVSKVTSFIRGLNVQNVLMVFPSEFSFSPSKQTPFSQVWPNSLAKIGSSTLCSPIIFKHSKLDLPLTDFKIGKSRVYWSCKLLDLVIKNPVPKYFAIAIPMADFPTPVGAEITIFLNPNLTLVSISLRICF